MHDDALAGLVQGGHQLLGDDHLAHLGQGWHENGTVWGVKDLPTRGLRSCRARKGRPVPAGGERGHEV